MFVVLLRMRQRFFQRAICSCAGISCFFKCEREAALRAASLFFVSLCMHQLKVRQNSFLLLLVVFGIFIASQLLGFLSGFLGALTLYFFLTKFYLLSCVLAHTHSHYFRRLLMTQL
jgi:hypothetical protein